MITGWDKSRIKTFVRHELGCTCPEDVFEHIELGTLHPDGCRSEATRLLVGSRLLIYLVDEFAIDNIERLAEAGRHDRDSNRYNRFRLVVSVPGENRQGNVLAESFLQTFASDEKMHLHFVDAHVLNGITRV